MERKSLKDISWQVSEKEYRADSALSYSTLAKYDREGFNNLNKLFDRVESPSLTFGSIVDTLLTGTEEEFNETFMVAVLDNPISDTLVNITKKIFDAYSTEYNNLYDIPDNSIIEIIEDIQWNNHWLPKTRVKKIKEDCTGYYKLIYLADNRTIISTATYNEAINTADKFKSADSTRFYFEPNNIFDNNIERFYQLKFKAEFNNVPYRIMADELIVIHDKKLIIPIDVKTSSKPEWDFYKSFIEWSYAHQARLYYRVIRDNLDKDSYFKDFTLADYRFIVCNRRTLQPLVWKFDDTKKYGELVYGKNKDIIIKDPFVIGEELMNYLKNRPAVPEGIEIVKPNNIIDWLNK